LLYLSVRHCRAQYDADQLPEARRTLARALHLAPGDHRLRFDVALTLQARAEHAVVACHACCVHHTVLGRQLRGVLPGAAARFR
jgi:hypothetical protein